MRSPTRTRSCIVLYGSNYWTEIINFDALARHGMISQSDLELFRYADDPATALGLLQAGLETESAEAVPSFAPSRIPLDKDHGSAT